MNVAKFNAANLLCENFKIITENEIFSESLHETLTGAKNDK
jgi:hypothetical protein